MIDEKIILSNDAILEILHKYGDIVIKTAYMFLKDRLLADDVYQEVFLKVICKYPGFDDPIQEKAWVIKITTNMCKDYVKTAWFRHVSLKDNPKEVIDSKSQSINLDSSQFKMQPEVACIANEDSSYIYKVVSDLPFKYKEIIILYYYHEFNTPQISKLLGKAESNIRNRLWRARKIIEKSLSKSGFVY